MSTTPITVAGLDGGGRAFTLRADQSISDNSLAMRSSLEVGGAAVVPANPMPVRAGTITISQTVVAVTTTSTPLVGANSNRKYLALMNIGVADVSLAIGGSPAVAASGWVLAAAALAGSAGGGLIWDAAAVPTQAFAGVVAAGSTNVVVLEGV